MVGAVAPMLLLDNLAITDRSRKFYDGTYKWDADGLTDGCGVYREFDCLDPLARAPTPMPPIFSADEEVNEQLYGASNEITQSLDSDTVTTPKTVAVEDMPYRRPTVSPLTPRSVRRSAIELIAKFKPKKIALQGDFDKQPKNDGDAAVKSGGNVPASKGAVLDEVVVQGLELPEQPHQAKTVSSNIKLPDTPPESPVNAVSATQIISPATTSTLSPVPSNLSDQEQEVGIRIKGASTSAQSTPSLPSTPSKTPSRIKTRGSTTRGVAQKVTKSSKRANAKPSPPNRKAASIEEFTLRELHSGAFMRDRGVRRSVRQAKAEGN